MIDCIEDEWPSYLILTALDLMILEGYALTNQRTNVKSWRTWESKFNSQKLGSVQESKLYAVDEVMILNRRC